MGQSQDPLTAEIEALRWLYAELLRIEQHWTEQVQNQQQRISTLLTVTGILLGFLAGAGFLTGNLSLRQRPWPAYLYVASLIVLCLALLMGIIALMSSIPIAGTSLNPAPAGGQRRRRGVVGVAMAALFRSFRPGMGVPSGPIPLWLDAQVVHERAESGPERALLRALCDAAAANQAQAHHQATLLSRRLLMYRQSAFLLLSLGLLILALVGFLVAGV